jgi:glycosyltransferase involved in cell wall biosynthesis
MSPVESAPVRKISVLVPMLNEAHRVEQLVRDIAGQDFDGELETFIADGGSTDGSVEQLAAAAAPAGLVLTMVPNPDRLVTPGLNACVERATGDLIVRLDCKARYPFDYLRRCAEAAEETGAWNVGGLIVPEGSTPAERAAACAMDSPFGGISWTRRGRAKGRVETDTVYCGAFRPEAFEHAGLFAPFGDDHDDEFNLRLRRAGGRVVLDPAIRVYYTPRGSLPEVFRRYHGYGFWKVPVMLEHRRVLSARSLAPLAFLGSLALLGLGARRSPTARRLLGAEVAVYAGSALSLARESARRRGEPWTLVPRIAASFAAFHAGYGAGMAHGWLRCAARTLSGTRRSRSGRARNGLRV